MNSISGVKTVYATLVNNILHIQITYPFVIWQRWLPLTVLHCRFWTPSSYQQLPVFTLLWQSKANLIGNIAWLVLNRSGYNNPQWSSGISWYPQESCLSPVNAMFFDLHYHHCHSAMASLYVLYINVTILNELLDMVCAMMIPFTSLPIMCDRNATTQISHQRLLSE